MRFVWDVQSVANTKSAKRTTEHGIKLSHRLYAVTINGVSYPSVDLTATISPADAPDKTVTWSVEWGDGAELASKAVTDYVTVTPDSSNGLKATVVCKKAFRGNVIVVKVKTKDGGYIATCSVTFEGKPQDIKDLFANEYYYTALSSNEVKTGYLPIDISCDDNFTLVGSSRKANFWDYLTFGATFDTSESEPMSPIIAIDYSTIAKLSDNEISTKYLVAEKDVPEFKQSVKDASGKGKVTYLFRFDTSTYLNVPFGYQGYGTVGYLAQEMAYLDFDIISLGYRKNNVVTKIPVVNSPIDIIATVEPGQDVVDVLGNLKNNGLKIVPLIIGAVLVVVIVKLVVDLFDNSGKRRKRK